jgi:hypothetical protein
LLGAQYWKYERTDGQTFALLSDHDEREKTVLSRAKYICKQSKTDCNREKMRGSDSGWSNKTQLPITEGKVQGNLTPLLQ